MKSEFSTRHESHGMLTGKKAIIEYCGRSWTTVKKWIDERGFPAAKISGVWESDKELIREWRKRQIGGDKQPKAYDDF